MKYRLHYLFSLSVLFYFSTVAYAQTASAPSLGAASGFALFTLAGAISNTGLSIVNGNVGNVSGAVTGISIAAPVPPAQTGKINGSLFQGGPYASTIDSFVQTAFVSLGGNSADSTLVYTSGLGSKQVLKPYVYFMGGATMLSDTLFLDGQGNPNSLFIFQINGVLTTSALSRIVLLNGASPSNIYWKINGAANLGINSIFQGTMIANGAISMGNGANLLGRALSTSGAINLDSNLIALPSQAPLPIDLVSFSARKEAGGAIKLSWITASEQNSSAFIVERSSNGRENAWAAIGSQQAAGTNSSTRQYTMLDNHAAIGANYYRLRAVNIDGTYSISNVAVAYSDVRATPISIFPNPAISRFSVTGAAEGSSILLMDMTGRILRNQTASGNSSDLIETGGLTSGNYLLHAVSADGTAVTLQMNKQ